MSAESAVELFVPGRVCLLGEHSDWAANYDAPSADISPVIGKCLVYATDCGLYATASKSSSLSEFTFTSTLGPGKPSEKLTVPFELAKLREVAQSGGVFSFACGTAAHILATFGNKVNGITINNHKTDLPVGKGLSSSAAVCVLVARAFNEVFGLGLTTESIMDAAYRGELETPSQCGRMDQCCAYGPGVVCMTITRDSCTATRVPLADNAAYHFVVADLQANPSKDTKIILSELNACFPAADTDVKKSAQHFLRTTSSEAVAAAIKTFAEGNVEAMGKLLVSTQEQFDAALMPACPSQLTAPVLHRTLNDAELAKLTFGGKGVGSQGDGTVQLLCKGPAEQAQVCEALRARGMVPMPITLSARQ